MNPDSYNYLMKFIIIGDAGVGKSCVLLQFIQERYRKNHDPTIGVEFGSKLINVDDKQLKLHIWDTAGQECYKSLTRQFYRAAIGAVVVYDITRRETFENVQRWIDDAKSNGNPHLKLVLVGNKSDLSLQREISYDEGKLYAQQNDLIFSETSAKDGDNVEQIFSLLAQKILYEIDQNQIDLNNPNCGIKMGNKRLEELLQLDTKINDKKQPQLETCC